MAMLKSGLTEQTAQDNLRENMKYLMEKKNISTRKELAGMLGVSEASLSKILNEGQIPGIFPFFVKAGEVFGYAVEELIGKNLRVLEERVFSSSSGLREEWTANYLGLFSVYHFKTTAFKGRELSDDAGALRAGVLVVVRNPENPVCHIAAGTFGLKKHVADALYDELKECKDSFGPEAAMELLRTRADTFHLYEGTAEVTASQVFYSLRFGDKDRVHMIFHFANGTESYLGGLGAMLSVGKGRFPQPCMQYIGMVRGSAPCAREEIAQNLLTHYPNIKAYKEVRELTQLLIGLYDPMRNEAGSALSDEEKEVMVLHYVDRLINETIERNLHRTVVVSAEDDSEFYHFLKRMYKYR